MFSFFCRALLDALEKIDWQPDIIHCNDWQTAALPIFLIPAGTPLLAADRLPADHS